MSQRLQPLKPLKPVKKFRRQDYVIDLETGERELKRDFYARLKRREEENRRRKEMEKKHMFIFENGYMCIVPKPPFPPALPNELRPIGFVAPDHVELHGTTGIIMQ